MACILRAVLSTGLLWPCRPVRIEGCRRRLLCRFGSSASASCAGAPSRWLNHPFASATQRCLRDGIPGLRLPGSAVYPRCRPLRTSRRPGGYAVTPAPGGRDLHPHGKLSYKVHHHLAVCPEAEASFRPTGRTSTKAVLMCQPNGASTCSTATKVPNTTRCVTSTNRRRRTVLMTWA